MVLVLAKAVTEGVDFFPIGKLKGACDIGWPFSHPHNETYHSAIEETVFRIINLARKHFKQLWLP